MGRASEKGGKASDTVIWTWNIQRARVFFPKRIPLADIMKVIAKSKAEIVLFSELNEERAAMQWIKFKKIIWGISPWKKERHFPLVGS